MYLAEMIESIQKQTYTNWQLILVDDGSTDQSGIICDKYRNEKVKVCHQKNEGQISARINGIMQAKGDYTLVVDADDALNCDCLQIVNSILNEKKYDMVMFPYSNCNERLKPYNTFSKLPNEEGEMTQQQVLQWVIKTYNHGLVNKVVKTNLIKKGVQEATRQRLKINGDYALIIPIICQIHNAFFVNNPLYLYRIHGESTSHSYCFQHLIDTDSVSKLVIDLLIKHNLYDDNNKALVFRAYLHMISRMTESLIINDLFNKNNFEELRKKSVYIESKSYENKKYFKTKEFYILIYIRNEFPFYMQPYLSLIKAKRNVKVILKNLYRKIYLKQ